MGTKEDLEAQNISLREGQVLVFYSEELEGDGMVHYSKKENLRVAVISWAAIRKRTSATQAGRSDLTERFSIYRKLLPSGLPVSVPH